MDPVSTSMEALSETSENIQMEESGSDLDTNSMKVLVESESDLISFEHKDIQGDTCPAIEDIKIHSTSLIDADIDELEAMLKVLQPVAPEHELISDETNIELREKKHMPDTVLSIIDIDSATIVTECDQPDEPVVFTNKSDALAAIKKYPGARFRQFASIDDAVDYASKPQSSTYIQSILMSPGEKLSFKTITSQQMVALRKAIEKGNEIFFIDHVWKNPRYLINNSDGPTVMQEGTRYNALHVAARHSQSVMFLIILETIQDPQFIAVLYPVDTSSMIEARIQRLVDLYLNIPDKSMSESPVHFACKYGCAPILAVLLSYSQCDSNKGNKYGLTPKEIICDRFLPKCDNLKRNMTAMFEAACFLPLVRDVTGNNSIGQPCHAVEVLAAILSSRDEESHVRHSAFAGPMPQSDFDNFYALLNMKKSIIIPPMNLPFTTPDEKRTQHQICRSDFVKGFERVGRKISSEMAVGWIEFWKPLEGWFDLSSNNTTDGFDCLNLLLKKQTDLVHSEVRNLPLNAEKSVGGFVHCIISFITKFIQKLPHVNIEGISTTHPVTFFKSFQNIVQHLSCMTRFSFSQEKEIYHIHEEIGHLIHLNLMSTEKVHFYVFKFQLFFILNALGTPVRSDKWKMFFCIMKFASYYQVSFLLSDPLLLKLPVCDCKWNVKEDSFNYSSSSCYFSILISRQKLSKDISTAIGRQEESLETSRVPPESPSQEDSFEEFHVPPESPIFVEEEFFTPPQSLPCKEIFVGGNEISDEDIDIFRAMIDGEVVIDESEHPYIFLWKHIMESKLGHLLKPDDRISHTPTSSSATIRRTVMPKKDELKKKLF